MFHHHLHIISLLLLLLVIITIFFQSSSSLSSARRIPYRDLKSIQISDEVYKKEIEAVSAEPSVLPSMKNIPHRTRFDAESHHEDFATFFVSVAAFRDPECQELVRESLKYAFNPRRIFLGIIEQNEPGDPICPPDDILNCTSADFCYTDNIRRRRVVSKRGKGPCYGRYVSMLMYRGENYYMMIDSHTGFVKHWDRRILFSLKRAHSPRPVLSHYPHRWIKEEPTMREAQSHVSVMCNGHYVSLGIIRLDGRMFPRSLEPWPAPFAAAGFLFADARLTHHVPFDPLLDYIFDGEEILYSTRMWTHGFDMFAPDQSFVFHSYGRKNASKFWGTQHGLGNRSNYARSVYWARKRVQYFLRVTKENKTDYLVPRDINVGRIRWNEKKYGLGNQRTLNAFNRYAMVDPIHRKAPAWFCNKVLKSREKM